MATDGASRQDGPPPPQEEVHLPGPSYLPAIVAAAVTMVVVGIVIFPYYILMAGVVIFVAATIRWIRQVREEMAELPLEH